MVMVAVAIGALIWNRRLLTLTIVCLLLGIPVIGLGAYALQGNYDFMWITEYPDHKGIGKSVLSAAARGLVVTETLEALPIDQFVALLNSPEMTKRFSAIKA